MWRITIVMLALAMSVTAQQSETFEADGSARMASETTLAYLVEYPGEFEDRPVVLQSAQIYKVEHATQGGRTVIMATLWDPSTSTMAMPFPYPASIYFVVLNDDMAQRIIGNLQRGQSLAWRMKIWIHGEPVGKTGELLYAGLITSVEWLDANGEIVDKT